VCKNKKTFNYESAKDKLSRHLRTKNYYITREWPYKNIKPRIMAEEFLEDKEKGDLWDYKFYCFHGEPQIMYISMGRQGNHVPFYFYDMNFNLLDLQRPHHERDDRVIEKPECWEEMIDLAKITSAGL